jgi:hypothetical protein
MQPEIREQLLLEPQSKQETRVILVNNEPVVLDLNLALLDNFLDNADCFASEMKILKMSVKLISV